MVAPSEPMLKSKSYKEASPMGSPPVKKSAAKQPQSESMKIISTALEADGNTPQMVQEFLGSLAALIKGGQARLVQIGQTVFMLSKFDNAGKPLPNATVNISPFSAEELPEVVERIKVLPNTLKEMGIKKFMMMAENPDQIQAIQMSGIKGQQKQSMTISNDQAVPALIFEGTL